MNNIKLYKPIVLISSISDMSKSQHAQAMRFLDNSDILTIGETGVEIRNLDDTKDNLPAIYFYGSEAVCIYRQMLGLPDIAIREIDINEITEATDNFDALFDIMFFLNNVNMKNNRIIYLAEIGVPSVILWNEYRVLREHVEFLQDNNWCDKPYINCFDVPDANDNPVHHREIRKSLIDIDYDLTEDFGYDPAMDQEDEDEDA